MPTETEMKHLTLTTLAIALAMPLASTALAQDDDPREQPLGGERDDRDEQALERDDAHPDHETRSELRDGERREHREHAEDRTRLDRGEAETLRWLEAEDPDFHAYIIELRSAQPMLYEREMMRAHSMKQLATDDPGLYRKVRTLEQKQAQLTQQAQDFQELRKRKQRVRRDELRGLANEIVALRHEIRQARLEQIREEVDRMERQLDQEMAERDERAERLVERAISGDLQARGYGEDRGREPERIQRPIDTRDKPTGGG